MHLAQRMAAEFLGQDVDLSNASLSDLGWHGASFVSLSSCGFCSASCRIRT